MSIGEQIRDAILGLQKFSTHSGFGDPVSVPLTADLALYAERAGDARIWEQIIVGGGTVTPIDGEAILSITGAASDAVALQSLRRARYQPGYGSIIRFAGRFATGGVADSRQFLGAFTEEDGLFVGFEGTEFGVFHRHDRALEITTLTITTGSAGVETGTVTLAGTAHIVALTGTVPPATAEEHTAAQIAAAGPYADTGSLYDAYNIGDTVVFVRRLAGPPPAGAFSFASSGVAAGTFAEDQLGRVGTQTFAPLGKHVGQLKSLDPLNGLGPSKITTNPQFANVYGISFGWLGYSGATFLIKDPDEPRFWPFHQLKWVNSPAAVEVLLRDPRMSVGGTVASLGSTTPIDLAMGSLLAGIAGEIVTGPKWARTLVATGVGINEVTVCGIQNSAVLNGRVNRRRLTITSIAVSNTGSKEATIRLRLNPVQSLEHWSQENPQSILLEDTVPSLVSGGTLIRALPVGAGETIFFSFVDDPIELDRTQSLGITGQTPASTTSLLVIANGNEDP